MIVTIVPRARMTPALVAHLADVATWPDPYTGAGVRGVQPALTIGGLTIPAGRVTRTPFVDERHRAVADVRAEECAACVDATASALIARRMVGVFVSVEDEREESSSTGELDGSSPARALSTAPLAFSSRVAA